MVSLPSFFFSTKVFRDLDYVLGVNYSTGMTFCCFVFIVFPGAFFST